MQYSSKGHIFDIFLEMLCCWSFFSCLKGFLGHLKWSTYNQIYQICDLICLFSYDFLSKFLADPPSGGVSSRFTHVRPCVLPCVRLCVYSWLNCLISLVLDEIYFWNLLETFLGYLYTSSKYFRISCMSVSLLVGFLSYWN